MRCILVCCVSTLVLPPAVRADVKLPPILSSHMVLQRDMAVPIWGMAAPGEKVAVKFRHQEKSVVADKDGKWLVKLNALKTGGPDVLTIKGTNTIVLEDVLVGEVWVGSGQSNMDGYAEIYARNDPGLTRLLDGVPYPQVRLARAAGGWKVADKTNALVFSALLLPFGIRLHQELGVPVGLMLGAVGGTPSGAWLSEEMFKADALCQEQVKQAQAAYDPAKAKQVYAAALKKWEATALKAKAENKPAPRKPDVPPLPGHLADGKFGYLFERHIKPLAPYAVRGVLWDQGENGTEVAGVDQFAVMGALIKGWRHTWGQDFAFLTVQKPSGGGPAFDPTDPVTDQADQFAALPASVPDISEYRELHLRLRHHPGTFLVTASDLGSANHPTNKSGYGYRAARVALGGVYGKPVEFYGPLYKSHTTLGNRVRVAFTHTSGGLKFKHGARLQGFAVAGADKAFHWADAAIDGDSVVLTCPMVSKPVAVRYAWAHVHPWANLFNGAGLPALPFKTDYPPAQSATAGNWLLATAFAIPKETTNHGTGYFSLVTGKNGRLYVGAAKYGVGASLVEFDPGTRKMKVVCDTHKAIGTTATGFAAQSKIHTRNNVGTSGKIYFGTKQGYQNKVKGEKWEDYPGGYPMVYDPATGQTRVYPIPVPHHGIISITPDESRGIAYISTCADLQPESSHFLVLDLKTGKYRDLMDCSHIFAFICIDHLGRAYHPIRGGEIARYDPATEKVERLKQSIDGKPPTRESLLALDVPHTINWDISTDGKTLYAVPMSGNTLYAYDLTASGQVLPGRRVGRLLEGYNETDCRAMSVGPTGEVWAAVTGTKDNVQMRLHLVRFRPGHDRTPKDIGPVALANPDYTEFVGKDGKPLANHHGFIKTPDGKTRSHFGILGVAQGPDGAVYSMALAPLTLLQVQPLKD